MSFQKEIYDLFKHESELPYDINFMNNPDYISLIESGMETKAAELARKIRKNRVRYICTKHLLEDYKHYIELQTFTAFLKKHGYCISYASEYNGPLSAEIIDRIGGVDKIKYDLLIAHPFETAQFLSDYNWTLEEYPVFAFVTPKIQYIATYENPRAVISFVAASGDVNDDSYRSILIPHIDKLAGLNIADVDYSIPEKAYSIERAYRTIASVAIGFSLMSFAYSIGFGDFSSKVGVLALLFLSTCSSFAISSVLESRLQKYILEHFTSFGITRKLSRTIRINIMQYIAIRKEPIQVRYHRPEYFLGSETIDLSKILDPLAKNYFDPNFVG